MSKVFRVFIFMLFISVTISVTYAYDLTKAYEMPSVSEIIKKDSIAPATKYTIPKSCKLDDLETITRGEYLFHNLNSKAAKEKAPKGLAAPKKGEIKPYGNCVACHNIENAIGGGTIGPDLSNYKKLFIDIKVRDAQFVYQKIADARIDNKDTSMTINLTTKMMNEQEICDLTAYVIQAKAEKK